MEFGQDLSYKIKKGMRINRIHSGFLIAFFTTVFFTLFSCETSEEKSPYLKSQEIALAPPMIISDSTFFKDILPINLTLDLEGAEIRYTLDNSEPDSNALLFDQTIRIKQSSVIKASAFHPDYLPSKISEKHFYKISDSFSIQQIELNRQPNDNYAGKGKRILINHVKGTKDFKSNEWLGFAGGNLELVLEGKQLTPCHQIILSFLSDQSSWIFLPKSVQVHTSINGKEYTFAAEEKISPTNENSESEFRFITIKFPEQKVKFIKIKIENIPQIPDWHPGKETAPWLFLDEVLVN